MTIPRQLAPTVGPAHGGVESVEGYLLGIDELAISGDEEEPAKLSLEDQSYG